MPSDRAAQIERDIADRVRRTCGYQDCLSLSITLYQDLSIYGDDAFYLLVEISKAHGTCFTGFNFAKFFPGEGVLHLYPLRRLLRLRDAPRRPFTFGHLCEVVNQGAWFDPGCVEGRYANKPWLP